MLYEKAMNLNAAILVVCKRFYENTDVGLFPAYARSSTDKAGFNLASTVTSARVDAAMEHMAPMFATNAQGNAICTWTPAPDDVDRKPYFAFNVFVLSRELCDEMNDLADRLTLLFKKLVLQPVVTKPSGNDHFLSKIVEVKTAELVTQQATLENNYVISFPGDVGNVTAGNYVYMRADGNVEIVNSQHIA